LFDVIAGERHLSRLRELSVDLLRDSYYALKRQAAPGVDGVTWREYGDGLEDRITDLHSRVHRGAYRAQPSRRVYIPNGSGWPSSVWNYTPRRRD
jgi:RNA-directed DNA polymerase